MEILMVRGRQRVIDHGEVFTPPGLVNDMLDLVAQECERSRFALPRTGLLRIEAAAYGQAFF
jgi:hypothetical protein